MTAADIQPAPLALARLSPNQIDSLDLYAFLAVLRKRVIHPGGRRSTQELLGLAGLSACQQVLDVSCGVATTGMQIARRFDAQVTAADLSPPGAP